jgi:hypothetical protein
VDATLCESMLSVAIEEARLGLAEGGIPIEDHDQDHDHHGEHADAATQCECWPSARRAKGSATATSAYAVRKPKTESEPSQSYMSEPANAAQREAAVAANMSPRRAQWPLRACRAAVGALQAAGSSLPCAMRISTRAAAVVQASTQANMLTAAPKSMPRPAARCRPWSPAGAAGWWSRSVCDDSPRKPSTSSTNTA